MMKKIIKLIFAVCFCLSFTSNASIICPSSINCNYKKGVCDQIDKWHLYSKEYTSPFSGTQIFELASISAVKTDFPNDHFVKYSFNCKYYRNGYNPQSNESSIILWGFTDKLSGDNWIFSGFGKAFANCSDISDPIECAGDEYP